MAPRAMSLGVLAFVTTLVVAGASSAAAQSATLSMSADRTRVQVGEIVRLQVRMDVEGAEASEPSLPDLSAFEIVSRQVSRPMSFRFGFGGQTPIVQSSSVYIFLLRAQRAGTFELAPARATVLGRTFASNALTLVIEGGARPAPTPGADPGSTPAPTGGNVPSNVPPTGPLEGAIYDDQAFLRTVVDRTDPYVGQQVTVTTYLYTRAGLRGSPVITHEPSTDGFWVHDLLPPQRTLEPTSQLVGSTPFRVYVLRRVAAFPLREGELTIGAMSTQLPVGGAFDLFAGPQPDLERTGVPVTVRVRAIPSEGRPAGEMHTGQLSLVASLDRTQVPTGDAVTLTVRATGSGMVQSTALALPEIPGLRALAPQSHDALSAPGDVVAGVRTFEWLVVPEREGSYSLPPFRVPCFDPATGTFSVAESTPLTLVAAGAAVGGDDAQAPSGSAAAERTTVDPDARFGPVRTRSQLSRQRDRWFTAPWYPFALGAFPGLWLAMIALRRFQGRARGAADPKRSAGRLARARLAVAEQAAASGDARAFYSALTFALRAVVEGRLGESIGSLTHAQLRRRLVERGMEEPVAQALVEELEGFELVRFSASGASGPEMQAALGRARERLSMLDRFVARPSEDA